MLYKNYVSLCEDVSKRMVAGQVVYVEISEPIHLQLNSV